MLVSPLLQAHSLPFSCLTCTLAEQPRAALVGAAALGFGASDCVADFGGLLLKMAARHEPKAPAALSPAVPVQDRPQPRPSLPRPMEGAPGTRDGAEGGCA